MHFPQTCDLQCSHANICTFQGILFGFTCVYNVHLFRFFFNLLALPPSKLEELKKAQVPAKPTHSEVTATKLIRIFAIQ